MADAGNEGLGHPRERLSFWTKAAYAIGDLGNSAGPGTIIPFWYLYFLINVARLDPVLAGFTVLLGKIWDAVNDPLVGILSDRTRTRWGRRRPFLLLGAIPFGVTFALLWIVPPIQNQIVLALYFSPVAIVAKLVFWLMGIRHGDWITVGFVGLLVGLGLTLAALVAVITFVGARSKRKQHLETHLQGRDLDDGLRRQVLDVSLAIEHVHRVVSPSAIEFDVTDHGHRDLA